MAKKIVIVDVEETLEDKVKKYRAKFHIMTFVSLFLILGFIICETKSTEKLFQEMNKNNNNYDEVLDESDYSLIETDFISNTQEKNNATSKVKSNTTSNKIVTKKMNDVVSTIQSNINVKKIVNPTKKNTISKTINKTNNIDNAISDKVSNQVIENTFENDSWDTIVLNVKSGKASNYKIGDTKKIELNIDGEVKQYSLIISNNSIKEGCSEASQTTCGFVLEFKDILYVNNDEKTDWENSSVRKYLNESLYELLPSTIKDNILETKIVLNDTIVSSDKIYLSNIEEVLTNNGKTGVKPIFRIG